MAVLLDSCCFWIFHVLIHSMPNCILKKLMLHNLTTDCVRNVCLFNPHLCVYCHISSSWEKQTSSIHSLPLAVNPHHGDRRRWIGGELLEGGEEIVLEMKKVSFIISGRLFRCFVQRRYSIHVIRLVFFWGRWWKLTLLRMPRGFKVYQISLR